MRYFIDTEFIEGFHKPLFGKRRHFIDLISIGIYCEDGRSYEAISEEYNYNDADRWVKENVILPLYTHTCSGDARNHFYADNFHKFYGKKNDKIREEILEFFGCYYNGIYWTAPDYIEVYAYFADYDWVLFCSLFGRMIDLPKGFPMYCKDLKQSLDDKIKNGLSVVDRYAPFSERTIFVGDHYKSTADVVLSKLKESKEYPKQTNEHDALSDAKWNYELYKFLNK